MSKFKQSLGRGLDALINPQNMIEENETIITERTTPIGAPREETISKIPVDLIDPNPFQPRTVFEPEALEELKKSILANGLIQPVTVRKVPGGRYQLISGERRLRACREIGFKEIPAYAIVVESDETMLAMALIENIQRERLNPIEIGLAYKRLMDECHLTQEQIAETVGKDRTTVANSIRLLKLPDEIKNSLIKEEISMGHARALINLPNPKMQLHALFKIKEGNLSVRKVEQLVKKLLLEEDGGASTEKSSKTSSVQASSNLTAVEDKLRKILGTKVLCRQKNDGSGELVIEYYSNDELDRLFDLFDLIEKNNF
jgi:ParB family chromosome partitioning protein